MILEYEWCAIFGILDSQVKILVIDTINLSGKQLLASEGIKILSTQLVCMQT